MTSKAMHLHMYMYMYSTVAVIKKFLFRFVWKQALMQNRRWMSDERSKDDRKMNALLSSSSPIHPITLSPLL